MCNGLSFFRIGTSCGSCEHGNESSRSINGGTFIDQVRDYQLLRKVSAKSS
jgi:hypothetical protein